MAVFEPSNELWAAVKSIDNTIWPPDNEEDVTKLAEDWRKAGETAHLAGTELSNAREASRQAWRDQGGQATGQQLGNGAVTLESQKRDCEQQAALADRYAKALTDVKTAIVQNIEMNLPAYLQLANPMYGASGPARQQEFAQKVAQDLKALVAGQTQGLQAPADAPDTDTTLGAVGDIAGMVSAVAGGLALIPVLTPFAAPVAVLAGGVALAAHATDMIATGSYDEEGAWVGLGGDVVGLVPGVRTMGAVVEAAGDASRLAPSMVDIGAGAADVLAQAPSAIDLFVNNDTVDDAKDIAGEATAGKNMVMEGINYLPR
ncbi:hypothetical protein FXN61_46735 [Lentzea sp. PSKA42]|uniref:Outer membrane channel protein CpnT-like N-terminal domain-containing protein n=1 Tax=Lentzea indica TaxID=2604800 RepID=A0ABX1FZ13_9PSEU|nr:hypothetical protein [Lentzea indica]NKE63806.1 hypothetical protein [Lentzea indica]